MSEVFNQRFLERVRRSRWRAELGEQPGTMDELARKARAAGHTGPLIVGPVRSSLKNSWRDDAKWLEENCPEEFGPPQKARSPEATGEVMSTGLRASLPSVIAPGPSQNALESAQSLPEVPPAPPPIPPLASSFWQGVLHGNQDSLVSGASATRALRLVDDRVGMSVPETEAIARLRVIQLRKLFHNRFGPAEAERGILQLWREAPPSPGASQPNEDQSRCSPGVWECPPYMPAWRRELHQGINEDQRLLEGIGGWCG